MIANQISFYNVYRILTALLACLLLISPSIQDETQKIYGIKGANLTPLAHIPSPGTYTVKGTTYTTKNREEAKNYIKEGTASYYHAKFNGRRTASGEVYNSALYTAAHKTLPLNSYAVITNLRNNRKVIVKINDRGPFLSKRVIDVSGAAAKELGLLHHGLGQVRVEALHVAKDGKISGVGTKTLVKHTKIAAASHRLVTDKKNHVVAKKNEYKIKIPRFSSKTEANKFLARLTLPNVKTKIVKSGKHYDIYFGPVKTQKEANQLKSTLQKRAVGKSIIIYSDKN